MLLPIGWYFSGMRLGFDAASLPHPLSHPFLTHFCTHHAAPEDGEDKEIPRKPLALMSQRFPGACTHPLGGYTMPIIAFANSLATIFPFGALWSVVRMMSVEPAFGSCPMNDV